MQIEYDQMMMMMMMNCFQSLIWQLLQLTL